MSDDLESVLVAYLEANPGVSALVAGRIYPQRLPPRVTLPAIRYQRISTRPEVAQTGPSNLGRVRVQLTVHAATYAGAAAVVTALRRALDGTKGLFGAGTSCFVINDLAGVEDESGQFVRYVDIEPWCREAVE